MYTTNVVGVFFFFEIPKAVRPTIRAKLSHAHNVVELTYVFSPYKIEFELPIFFFFYNWKLENVKNKNEKQLFYIVPLIFLVDKWSALSSNYESHYEID